MGALESCAIINVMRMHMALISHVQNSKYMHWSDNIQEGDMLDTGFGWKYITESGIYIFTF